MFIPYPRAATGSAEGALAARSAAKVDHSPAVGAGQPYHVAGLEVAVHVARSVKLRHSLRNVVYHLHNPVHVPPAHSCLSVLGARRTPVSGVCQKTPAPSISGVRTRVSVNAHLLCTLYTPLIDALGGELSCENAHVE